MEHSPYFYHFLFQPVKLLEERQRVEKKYRQLEKNLAHQRGRIRLPQLLELIRKTPLEQIEQLAQTLKKIDVLMLIYEYPYHEEDDHTQWKINHILLSRYVSTVGQRAWSLFQHDLKDQFLLDLVCRSYTKEPDMFLGLDEELREGFGMAVAHEKGLVSGLCTFLVHSKIKSKEIWSKLKIKEDSELQQALVKGMLLEGLKDDFIIYRDGAEYLTGLLHHFELKDYKAVMKGYFESRNHTSFHYPFMNQATLRLLDPREREEEWQFLSPRALEEVKKWLLINELKRFFKNDATIARFRYWKRYIHYIQDVKRLDNPVVAFIYFDPFVVVEFGEKGAAYFYHTEGFKDYILPQIDTSRFRTIGTASREQLLKDTTPVRDGTPLFIHRLKHYSGWERKFDRFMQKYFIYGIEETR